MKKSLQGSNLTVTVKGNHNHEIIEFDVPSNTKMKNVNQILWDNKLEFENNK